MKLFHLVIIGEILFLLFFMGCGSRDKALTSKALVAEQAESTETEEQKLDSLLKAVRQKNPFRPDHAVGPHLIEGNKDNILKGIVWDAQKPFAIIGDRVVMEGDDIDNKKVIRIEKDSVTLEIEGREETLRLEESFE